MKWQMLPQRLLFWFCSLLWSEDHTKNNLGCHQHASKGSSNELIHPTLHGNVLEVFSKSRFLKTPAGFLFFFGNAGSWLQTDHLLEASARHAKCCSTSWRSEWVLTNINMLHDWTHWRRTRILTAVQHCTAVFQILQLCTAVLTKVTGRSNCLCKPSHFNRKMDI